MTRTFLALLFISALHLGGVRDVHTQTSSMFVGVSVLQASRVVTTVEYAIRRRAWRALLLDEPPSQ